MSMMQRYLFGLIALVALPAMSGAAANQSIKHVVGDAFGLKSNDLIYRETHCGGRFRGHTPGG